jgi:6-phosphogluconolactonase/glucosamine-6-phosphate isomerase/deaminase
MGRDDMAVLEAKNLVVEPTARLASAKAAEIFRAVVNEAVDQRELCRVALSGGSTPRIAYHQLAQQAMTDGLAYY